MPNPVVHWEIHGSGGPKLEGFYRDLFDWHVEHIDQMNYGMVDTHAEGGINGGISGVGPSTPPGKVIVYVQVDDLDAYLKKSESLGGKTVVPVTEVPNVVTFAITTDPEGNWVGLVKEQ
jgi:predicted enzyme related to lactoylglutathione lyase